MSKTLSSLPKDINNLLGNGEEFHLPTLERQVELGTKMVQHVLDEIRPRERIRDPNEVYVTQLTSTCERKSFYDVLGTSGEVIPGDKRFKFLFGDMIEESLLVLAEAARHKVERRQFRYEYHTSITIVGRIDAIIDNVLVDVKSMNSYSFEKLKSKAYDEDQFILGYINQLSMYGNMHYKTTGEHIDLAILAVNKQNGDIHVEPVTYSWDEDDFDSIVHWAESVRLGRVDEGDLGGPMHTDKGVLCTMCGYCPYKFSCFPTLRVYAYAKGPTFIVPEHSHAKKPKAGIKDITKEYKAQAKIKT